MHKHSRVMDRVMTIYDVKRLMKKDNQPNSTLRISIHAKIIIRHSQHEIAVADNTGKMTLSIYNRANVLLRSGEILSFVNLCRRKQTQRLRVTFATSIQRLPNDIAERFQKIPFIPEETICSKDLKHPSLNRIILKKLFLRIILINQPEMCHQTKQSYQEIICHDNDNIVTIRLQSSLLASKNLLARKLAGYTHCVVQDFYIIERFEYNVKIKIVEQVSTLNPILKHDIQPIM